MTKAVMLQNYTKRIYKCNSDDCSSSAVGGSSSVKAGNGTAMFL